MTDPRIRDRRIEVARAAGRRRLRYALVAAGVVTVVIGGLALVHSSLFSARHVVIVGSAGVPRKAILAAAGLVGAPPLIDINAGRASAGIERLPTVATASVSVRWPDSVDIRLTGRTAVAAIPLGAGKGANAVATVAPQYALVDAPGRVLSIVRVAPANLPIVLASAFAGQPGTFLRPEGEALVTVARTLGSGLAAEVQAVGYDTAGQIALTLRGGPVAIFGDPSQLVQKLVSLETVLHDVQLGSTATIDLSSPSSPILTPIGAGRSVVLVAGG